MSESFTLVCAYCGRAGQVLESCCGRPHHAHRLVCADIRDCLSVVLGQLHDADDDRAAGPVTTTPGTPGRRLCAHADTDGKGMHWLEPGEVCPLAAAPPGGAEQQARRTAASAVLADYVRWTTGDTISAGGTGDWQAWADRLAAHLGYLIEAASR